MNRRSFTLIELLIVLIIIGILAIIIMPYYGLLLVKSYAKEAQDTLGLFATAAWMYYIESGDFPGLVDGAGHPPPPNLGANIPTSTKYFSYSYTYIGSSRYSMVAADKRGIPGLPMGAITWYMVEYKYDTPTYDSGGVIEIGHMMDAHWYRYYSRMVKDAPNSAIRRGGW